MSDSSLAEAQLPCVALSLLADEAFGMAKDDDMHVEVQWQDADSSSSASFCKHYPDETKSRIMLCAGHVGRCHTKALTKLSQKKSFTK